MTAPEPAARCQRGFVVEPGAVRFCKLPPDHQGRDHESRYKGKPLSWPWVSLAGASVLRRVKS